jgi:hypothetical protein
MKPLVEDADGVEAERPLEAAADVTDRNRSEDPVVPPTEVERDRLANGHAPVGPDLEGDREAVDGEGARLGERARRRQQEEGGGERQRQPARDV